MKPTQNLLVLLCGLCITASSMAADELIIFPNEGQSNEQLEADKFACYGWAKNQSDFDPMAPPKTDAKKGATVKGSLRGAAIGGIIGGSDGAKKGAGAGQYWVRRGATTKSSVKHKLKKTGSKSRRLSVRKTAIYTIVTIAPALKVRTTPSARGVDNDRFKGRVY
jgi:hypothetical protein